MRTIDMTPTWTETARMLVFIMENANEEGVEQALKEIIRMGEIIDAYRAKKIDDESVGHTVQVIADMGLDLFYKTADKYLEKSPHLSHNEIFAMVVKDHTHLEN